MEYLVIVESPAKAKTIKKYLGKNYKVEASMGHVRDLPKSKIGVDTNNNFEPTYITIRGKGELIGKLRKAAKGVDRIFLATDPDREGEAISWHLAHILNIDYTEKCRISFNEITKSAVENAVSNPKTIDMNLVDAQQARRILDRIVGYKISPLLWKKVKKGLSAGRVQSVATRMICDRENEIENFVTEEYWSLIAKLTPKNKAPFFAKFFGDQKGKIELKSQQDVDTIIKKLGNSKFVVNKIKNSEKKKVPFAPFTTSTLQQEAYRKLGFTTKKTMMIAQQLYEGVDINKHGAMGLVTYIRTDSVRISDDALSEVREYITSKFGSAYLYPTIRTYKNKSASQDAHEAIRPSYLSMAPLEIKESLSPEQFKLYKLIWERFVASQMSNALYDTLSVDLNVNDYIFRASGSKIKFQGFMNVYSMEKDSVDEDEEMDEEMMKIPELAEGEVVPNDSTNPKQHFTEPPARYSEAGLVKAMEEKGIGRPSTYAPTISTILARGYVDKQQKLLFPTELGKIVTNIMKNYFQDIVDLDFTAQMEQRLDDVEEGKTKWEKVLEHFYTGFEDVMIKAEQNIEEVKVKDIDADILCSKCGRMMVYKLGKKGKKFIACPGFPACRNTLPVMVDANVSCPKCKGKIYLKDSKRGRKYVGCENYPACDFMSWDKPSGNVCPKCANFLFNRQSGKKTFEFCSSENCDFGKEELDIVDKNKLKGRPKKEGEQINKKVSKISTVKGKTIKDKVKSKATKKELQNNEDEKQNKKLEAKNKEKEIAKVVTSKKKSEKTKIKKLADSRKKAAKTRELNRRKKWQDENGKENE